MTPIARPYLLSLLLLFCGLMPPALLAQETQGLALSNYATTDATRLNPALIVDSKVWLDMNFIGFNGFAHNNYLYYPKTIQFPTGVPGAGYDGLEDDYTGGRKYAIMDILAAGPAFTLALGRRSVGAHISGRGIVNMRKIPLNFVKFAFDGVNYAPQHDINYIDQNFNVKYMGWMEAGVTYGQTFNQWGNQMWTIGGTLKRTFGIAHGAMIVNTADYEVLGPDTLLINNVDLRYAYSPVGFNSGRGWGLDLGVTYRWMLEDVTHYIPHSRNNGCREIDYKFKVGASLLDFGYIRYKADARERLISGSSAVWENYQADSTNDPEQRDLQLLEEFGESNINTDNVYSAALPTALTAQFDYNFENNFFFGGVIVQRFGRPNSYGVERGNLISIMPRFETRYFEASMPLSWYNYRRVGIGLSFRLYSIQFGTENILPYLGVGDVYGGDAFFFMKYWIRTSKQCRGTGRRYRRPKCPSPGG